MLVENLYETLYVYKYLARPFELQNAAGSDAMPEVSDRRADLHDQVASPGRYFADSPAFPDGKGREITAADFVFSLKRHFDPATRPQGAWLWQGRVAGIDAVERLTVPTTAAPVAKVCRRSIATPCSIRLVRPYPQLVYTLDDPASVRWFPARRSTITGASSPLTRSAPGRSVWSRMTARKAVLERNPSYRSEPIDLAAEGYDPETQAGFRAGADRRPHSARLLTGSRSASSRKVRRCGVRSPKVMKCRWPRCRSEQVYRVMASVRAGPS